MAETKKAAPKKPQKITEAQIKAEIEALNKKDTLSGQEAKKLDLLRRLIQVN